MRTSTIKRDIPIKRLRNGIFIKSNTKRFTEVTNCHLLQRLVELALLFFNDVEEHEFLSDSTKPYLKLGERFSLQSLELHTVSNQKKIGLLILLNCEATSLTVFTTMCLKEQQTSNNLIVKDYFYCFITGIFDKFGFSDVLRGCLSRLNEAWKE